MSQYKDGRASADPGIDTVIGTGTLWKTGAVPVKVGACFKFNGEDAVYNVNAIIDDTTIKISPAYAGAETTNALYSITGDFTTNGLVEISPQDSDWFFYMNRNMRKLDAVLGAAVNGLTIVYAGSLAEQNAAPINSIVIRTDLF